MKLRAKQETRLKHKTETNQYTHEYMTSLRKDEVIELDMDDFEVIEEPEKLQEIEMPKEIAVLTSNESVGEALLLISDWMQQVTKAVNQLIKEME